MKTFTKNATITFITQIIIVLMGLVISIIVARSLGPEGKGFYSLAFLIPSLIMVLANLGISTSTVFFTAKESYDKRQIFGNNITLSLVIGGFSLIIGALIIVLFGEKILPGVPKNFALMALLIIPFTILVENLKNIFLGMQKIALVNISTLIIQSLNLILIIFSLFIIKSGVTGLIGANISALMLASLAIFFLLYRTLKTPNFKLNYSYIKSAMTYGLKTHIGNILGFLNYRLDIFLVNFFLDPFAVGLYSISVGITEKLWLASKATSTVLLPKIAAEKSGKIRKELTPIVSRNVLWLTAIGALVLFLITGWVVNLLYSASFLPAVRPLQILLPGIVALSASRILANDIAGRGKPLINSYLSFFALITNLILNILWIPKFGIEGAAWATTVSYSGTLVGRVLIYSRISGNPIAKILIIQPSDWLLYKKLIGLTGNWIKKRLNLT